MANTSTLVEDFGSSLGSAWTIQAEEPIGVVGFDAGELVYSLEVPAGSDYSNANVITTAVYTFDHAFVRVEMAGGTAPDQQAWFTLSDYPNGAATSMWCDGATLTMLVESGGSSYSTNVAYDSAAHQYWRMRRIPSGGPFGDPVGVTTNRVMFYASGDGSTWTHLATSDFAFAGGVNFLVNLYGECNGSPGDTCEIRWDHVNVARPIANDAFENAATVVINGAPYTIGPIDNRLATLQTGEPLTDPAHDWYGSGDTLWWSYTPLTSGTVTVHSNGSARWADNSQWADTVLGVYTGTAVDALTQVAWDDDSGDGNTSLVTFEATGGTTYWIALGGYNQNASDPYYQQEHALTVDGPDTAAVGGGGSITGVPATADAVAPPGFYGLNVDGTPATATVAASSDAGVTTTEWAAIATAVALPARPTHDDIAAGYVLTGMGGSGTIIALGATREAGEPDGIAAPANAESVWLTYTPTVPGDLSITTSAGVAVEIWEGTSYTDLSYVAGAATASSSALAAGVTYSIRLAPTTVGAIPPTISYSWTYTERVAELVLNVDTTELEDTPATVRVSVLNGTADGPAEFTFNSAVIYSDTFDGSGVIADLDLTLPETPAGTYTLLVTDTTSTDYDSVTITILEDPLEDPDDTITDEDPTIDPEIVRWVVQDPYGSTPDYEFPINPREMSTPFPERTLTTEVTTALDGQPLVWEGARRPHSWQFTGHIEAQAHYEALEGYVESNQRWWLIDHRHRGWLVTFESFEPTLPTRTDPAAPYRSSYVMRCLTYIGPVMNT